MEISLHFAAMQVYVLKTENTENASVAIRKTCLHDFPQSSSHFQKSSSRFKKMSSRLKITARKLDFRF